MLTANAGEAIGVFACRTKTRTKMDQGMQEMSPLLCHLKATISVLVSWNKLLRKMEFNCDKQTKKPIDFIASQKVNVKAYHGP